jgi:uncharacterized membrane protein
MRALTTPALSRRFSELASDAVLDHVAAAMRWHSRPGLVARKAFIGANGRGPLDLRLSIARRDLRPGIHPTPGCDNHHVTDTETPRRIPIAFAIFLIVAGILGWWAAFSLTLDKILVLQNPEADLDCNFSVIVQCGKNLGSWQGAVFGFPNPLIGLGGFVAPIAVGVGLLAGARFARWFWIAFNVGIAGALAFVIWLISQSIFVLGTLCPWCMLVWSVTIPLFWVVTSRNLAEGVYGSRAVSAGRGLLSWVIPIVIVSYVLVAFIAQLRLDIIGHLALGSL